MYLYDTGLYCIENSTLLFAYTMSQQKKGHNINTDDNHSYIANCIC